MCIVCFHICKWKAHHGPIIFPVLLSTCLSGWLFCAAIKPVWIIFGGLALYDPGFYILNFIPIIFFLRLAGLTSFFDFSIILAHQIIFAKTHDALQRVSGSLLPIKIEPTNFLLMQSVKIIVLHGICLSLKSNQTICKSFLQEFCWVRIGYLDLLCQFKQKIPTQRVFKMFAILWRTQQEAHASKCHHWKIWRSILLKTQKYGFFWYLVFFLN